MSDHQDSLSEFAPDAETRLYTSAEVRAAAIEDTAALLRLLKRRQEVDATYLDERPPFFWEAEISSTRLDAYYTRMDASTLKNFRDDAKAGINFQNSHITRQLGFGRSFDASFDAEVEPGVSRTRATFYTVPGLRLNDVTTDDFIGGIRSGILADVSVGFYGGEARCDVCNRDLWDWDCWHYPGYAYPLSEWEENGTTPTVTGHSNPTPESRARGKKAAEETAIATATYFNARLAEVSVVYDGATPGAVILKAQRDIAEGRMRPAVARLLEQRYRIRLPEGGRIHAVGDIPTPNAAGSEAAQEDRTMANNAVNPPAAATAPADVQPTPTPPIEERGMELLASLAREARPHMHVAEGAEPPSDLAVLQNAVGLAAEVAPLRERLVRLEARVLELEPQAELGVRYREAVIAATLEEGVRAMGATFNVEATRALLAGQSLPVIEAQHAQYRAFAAQRFRPGALVETPDSPDAPSATQTQEQRMAYAAAYRV